MSNDYKTATLASLAVLFCLIVGGIFTIAREGEQVMIDDDRVQRRQFVKDGQLVSEHIFFDWKGSGERFGTVHGRLIWELISDGGDPLPMIYADFNLGGDRVRDARKSVEEKYQQMRSLGMFNTPLKE